MSIGEKIKLLSANCQGLQTKAKMYDVLNYYIDQKPNILCLQDTHLTSENTSIVKSIWKGECLLHGTKTNSRGVAILLGNNFEYKIHNIYRDSIGNLMVIDIKISDFEITLVNIYAPNQDSPEFFDMIENIVHESKQDYILICGDLNLVLDPAKDCYNYTHVNNPRSRNILMNIITEHNLIDIFREFHPHINRYTWRRKNPIRQARLDYWICSRSFCDLTDSCKIIPGYRSDHSAVELKILINHFERGKGIWKLNASLLKDPIYVNKINNIIQDVVAQYVVPVYAREFILCNDNYEHLSFTINYDLFLETLLLRIRGETIKYSSYVKKQQSILEEQIIEDIKNLENSSAPFSETVYHKKEVLENLRTEKMKGHFVRSRTQWATEGEKPTKYFCSLENKNFIEKTVKCLKVKDTYITEQKQILHEMKAFYSQLYSNRDQELTKPNLNDLFQDIDIRKLTPSEANELEGPITLDELSSTLKNMKSNKTPGIDGFPSEFFKVFWSRIKIFVLKAINFSFEVGEFSTSFRRCIITCLPKGDKVRNLLKNWRPISLLSVIYKLASATIANRIKTVLDFLIARTQSGFISGRYIGESTRLVYDIMHHTEQYNINGLLMLIDFEKAFDSISWEFMYKTFEFFGFPSDTIKWLKLFNTNIQSAIIQCGFLSEFFPIKRGCKQRDPLAC